MSEEPVPKLRLKPRLAANPADANPQPAASAPEPVASPVLPVEPPAAAQPETPPAGASTPPLPADDDKLGIRFSLKASFPIPEGEQSEPPVSDGKHESEEAATDHPVLAPDGKALVPGFAYCEEDTQPPWATEPPMPGGKKSKTLPPFPPHPPSESARAAGASRPPAPWAKPAPAAAGSNKKFVMVGAGLVALLVLGGAYMGYRKFTAVPPPPPRRPKPAAVKPVVPAGQPPAPVAGGPTAATPTPVPVAVVEPPPEPVVPPAPAASPAFHAWVENLKIGGVRGGSTSRVFIGATAYAPGDVVNPQLGIVFEEYNAETRMLTFKDKTGAKVERRN